MTSKSLTDAIEYANQRSIAAGSVASELARWNRLHERLFPPGMRSILEMNEKFQRLADPLGLRKLNDSVLRRFGTASVSKLMGSETVRAASLHSELASVAGIHDEPEWMKMNRRFAEMMGPTAPWREITKAADVLGASSSLVHQLARMSKFDAVLGRSLPPNIHAVWSDHLKALAMPAASILAHEWSKPMGLIAELPTANLGGSVSWLMRRRGKPLIATASLLPADDQIDNDSRPTVITDGEPLCAICDGPMVSLGTILRWHGPKRATKHRRLFPACSRCMKRERDEPGFLLDHLTRLTRPRLYAIDGGRQGNGVRTGYLRLVRVDVDDDAPV